MTFETNANRRDAAKRRYIYRKSSSGCHWTRNWKTDADLEMKMKPTEALGRHATQFSQADVERHDAYRRFEME
jgi:hypothetical protein